MKNWNIEKSFKIINLLTMALFAIFPSKLSFSLAVVMIIAIMCYDIYQKPTKTRIIIYSLVLLLFSGYLFFYQPPNFKILFL